MQSTILVILIAATYLVLLIQYKKAAIKGAKDLLQSLINETSLHSLNNRTLLTAPMIFVSIIAYSLVSSKITLELSVSSWQFFEIIVLCCLCFLVSIFSGFIISPHYCCNISLKEKIKYFSIRIPGLIVYEIFFRGVLLEIFLQFLSIPFSIALNIFLYALAHAFCSRKEFFGSILFGFVLCCIAIINRSAYPCVLMHLAIALPYEMIILNKYHPTIKNIRL